MSQPSGKENTAFVHGHVIGGRRSSEQQSYTMMKQRCLNPNRSDYRYYGGRGITICSRWLESFVNFIADMGAKPNSAHTLDRIDDNGNYEPSNCRWVSRKAQAQNRRRKSCFRWPPEGSQEKYPRMKALE